MIPKFWKNATITRCSCNHYFAKIRKLKDKNFLKANSSKAFDDTEEAKSRQSASLFQHGIRVEYYIKPVFAVGHFSSVPERSSDDNTNIVAVHVCIRIFFNNLSLHVSNWRPDAELQPAIEVVMTMANDNDRLAFGRPLMQSLEMCAV